MEAKRTCAAVVPPWPLFVDMPARQYLSIVCLAYEDKLSPINTTLGPAGGARVALAAALHQDLLNAALRLALAVALRPGLLNADRPGRSESDWLVGLLVGRLGRTNGGWLAG